MWFWSHTPAPLQPAVVQALLSLSGHGVLSVANVCVCTHTPSSEFVGLTSQPASVHTLPSVSVHGVLVFGVHCPLVVSQPRCTHRRPDTSWSRDSGRTHPRRCSPPSCRRCCRCPGRACCRSRTCASARTPPA